MARPPDRPFTVPLPRLHLRRAARRLRRSPAVWWLAAAAVAAYATTQVHAIDEEARARRAAWGESVPVAVATRAVAAGEVLGPLDVVVEAWPAAVVPDGALDVAPVGRTATAPIVAGEAVVRARLAPEGLSEVAARLPPGWRAVAIPAVGGGSGSDLPPLAIGDHVDVLASYDAFDVADGSTEGQPAGVVAEAALVVDVTDTSVTVGVPAGVAPDVAFATTRGTVTLALVGAA